MFLKNADVVVLPFIVCVTVVEEEEEEEHVLNCVTRTNAGVVIENMFLLLCDRINIVLLLSLT